MLSLADTLSTLLPSRNKRGTRLSRNSISSNHRATSDYFEKLDEEIRPRKRKFSEQIRVGHFEGIAGKAWFLPYHDANTAETPAMRAAYPTMLRNPSVKSSIATKVLGVASLDWQVQPDDAKSPRENEFAEFCKFNVERLPEGMPGAILAMMMPHLVDGFQLTEPVLAVEEEDTEWRNRIVLDALKPKKRDTYDFEVDSHLNVVGVRGLGPNMGDCWSIRDFVYSRYMPMYDDPLGTSDFRAAYTPYWFRDTVTKLRAINAEKSTGGVLVGTYGTGDGDKSDAERALQQAKSNTWMAVPEGVKVEALQLASKGEQDWKSFIDDCDKQILIAIVGAYLQVLESTTTNARGDAKVSKTVSELFTWLIAVQVQQIFNKQIFPLIGRYNYAGLRTPRLVLGGVSEEEVTKIIANLTGLRGLGITNLSKKAIFQRTGAQMALDKEDELGGAPMPPPMPGLGGGGFGGQIFSDNAGGWIEFAQWSPHKLQDGTMGWKSDGGLIRRDKPRDLERQDNPVGARVGAVGRKVRSKLRGGPLGSALTNVRESVRPHLTDIDVNRLQSAARAGGAPASAVSRLDKLRPANLKATRTELIAAARAETHPARRAVLRRKAFAGGMSSGQLRGALDAAAVGNINPDLASKIGKATDPDLKSRAARKTWSRVKEKGLETEWRTKNEAKYGKKGAWAMYGAYRALKIATNTAIRTATGGLVPIGAVHTLQQAVGMTPGAIPKKIVEGGAWATQKGRNAVRRVTGFAEVDEGRMGEMVVDIRMMLRRHAAGNGLPLPLVTDEQIIAAIEASLPPE